MVSMIAVGGVVILGGLVMQLVAWIGAMINTVRSRDKTWFVLLLVLGRARIPVHHDDRPPDRRAGRARSTAAVDGVSAAGTTSGDARRLTPGNLQRIAGT
jgi:hypothetical protein